MTAARTKTSHLKQGWPHKKSRAVRILALHLLNCDAGEKTRFDAPGSPSTTQSNTLAPVLYCYARASAATVSQSTISSRISCPGSDPTSHFIPPNTCSSHFRPLLYFLLTFDASPRCIPSGIFFVILSSRHSIAASHQAHPYETKECSSSLVHSAPCRAKPRITSSPTLKTPRSSNYLEPRAYHKVSCRFGAGHRNFEIWDTKNPFPNTAELDYTQSTSCGLVAT